MSQQELQSKLVDLFGCENVYYQPPESKKMEYPAIRYSKDKIDKKSADDAGYLFSIRYQITVIDKRPDNPVINKILKLPKSSFDRHYKSDGLNHDVLTLYY